jgi:hypothetical protein
MEARREGILSSRPLFKSLQTSTLWAPLWTVLETWSAGTHRQDEFALRQTIYCGKSRKHLSFWAFQQESAVFSEKARPEASLNPLVRGRRGADTGPLSALLRRPSRPLSIMRAPNSNRPSAHLGTPYHSTLSLHQSPWTDRGCKTSLCAELLTNTS